MTSSTPDTGEFKSKRILVTGGTKGAGKAIAHRFLRGAGTVIITARPSPEAKTESYFIQADVELRGCGKRSFARPWIALRALTSSSTMLEAHPLPAAAYHRHR
jgi:NAD(P)-dependent dehydrogenase (short-subunit alcohol dehydrogenase family)